jgi:hypothetical protein
VNAPEFPPISLSPPATSLRHTKRGRRRPQIKLQVSEERLQHADWASLFGDLSRRQPLIGQTDRVEWRVHDKTHLEFAIDYPLDEEQKSYVWESYFFLPESFRLNKTTYDKRSIYEDLLSYIRLAVPEHPFPSLGNMAPDSWLTKLHNNLQKAAMHPNGSPKVKKATRSLRLFACLIRSSGVHAMREVERTLSNKKQSENLMRTVAITFAQAAAAIAHNFHSLLDKFGDEIISDHLRVALKWVDEDISLVLEALTSSLAIKVATAARNKPSLSEATEALATCAVNEARHRQTWGYDSIATSGASARNVEHLEFRRHVLKRFTSSVLWLTLEVKAVAPWLVHSMYAVAAAVAMSFALLASSQSMMSSGTFSRYALLVVIAYAAKDRIKALLQNIFSNWVEKRFADRKWTISDSERSLKVGHITEKANFTEFQSLPSSVLEMRRCTRLHALEEDARPESVLFHEKTLQLHPQSNNIDCERFPMLTEIFRLNLRHWLVNTDDPIRKINFADPQDAHIYSAKARRVYNVNVVYRLRNADDLTASWHRLRLVVSRKGLARIEKIA